MVEKEQETPLSSDSDVSSHRKEAPVALQPGQVAGDPERNRPLPAAAERAIAEAEERRQAERLAEEARQRERELGGQKGPEPTRYGDWEKGGIVSDF